MNEHPTNVRFWMSHSCRRHVFVLLVATILLGCSSFRKRTQREISLAPLPTGPGSSALVTAKDLSSLPEPAQRYLRFMKVVGLPRIWSFRAGWRGRFRAKPSQSWMPCEAHQYNSLVEISRIFHIRATKAMIPVVARDTYLKGRGRMHIQLLDWIEIDDARGKELDIGELVTFLNDAVLIAPGMLLELPIDWRPIDERSFALTLHDAGTAVTAQVYVDRQGAPTNFITEDRFLLDESAGEKKWVRRRWSTPVKTLGEASGRKLVTRAQAVWLLEDGPFAYADFEHIPDSFAFNVSPHDGLPAQ